MNSLFKWDFIISYYSRVLQLTFLFCFLMVLLIFFTNKWTHTAFIVSKELCFFLLWLVDKPTLQRQILVDVQSLHSRCKLWWTLNVNWYRNGLYSGYGESSMPLIFTFFRNELLDVMRNARSVALLRTK